MTIDEQSFFVVIGRFLQNERMGKLKKSIIITLVTMLAFTLSACANNNTEANIIVRAELTDRENAILSTTSNQEFVFDFHIESEYKEAAVWIEKYEFGKLVDERIGYLTTEIENNGSIILTMDDLNASENQIFFNIGINSNGVTGSSTISEIISTKGRDSRSSLGGSITDKMEITNDAMVLASIVFAWDKSSMSSFPNEFYIDAERGNSELENHEVVYLLKSAFTK